VRGLAVRGPPHATGAGQDIVPPPALGGNPRVKGPDTTNQLQPARSRRATTETVVIVSGHHRGAASGRGRACAQR